MQTLPIRVVHADCLLTVQHAGFVAHHTRLVEGGLTVENQDIAIPKMPVNFLVDSRRGSVQAMTLGRPVRALLRRQQLVRNRRPLFESELFLEELNVPRFGKFNFG